MASLRMYLPSPSSDTYIDCWCTRWDESDWTVTIETFLDSSNRETLCKNITPGIVREIGNILWKPWYVDGTFRKENTIYLQPISGYGLSGVRQSREITVKNYSDTIITPNYFSVKIEGYRTRDDVEGT